jgi:hypothetical protein
MWPFTSHTTDVSAWRRVRNARIERRATALTNLASATQNLAESEFTLTAARDLQADVREHPTPSPSRKTMTTADRLWTVMIGILANGAAIFMAIIALGLGTTFWAAHLPSSAQSVHIFAVPLPIDLTTMIPVGFESTIWVLTAMATVLACFSLRSGAYTRPMWAIASVIALINGVHNSTYDLLGGLGLGALSLASPYLVHKYVLFVRSMTHGKTILESIIGNQSRWKFIGKVAAALAHALMKSAVSILDFILHPVLTILAVLLWRMHRGISYGHAHGVVVTHLRNRRAGWEKQGDRQIQTYQLRLIDLIDPVEIAAPRSPRKRSSTPVPRAAQAEAKEVPVAVIPPTEEPEPTNLVSIEQLTGRPEWVTHDMTPAEAMTAHLNHLGETQGVLLERWANSVGYRDKYSPGLGRKTLYTWRKQQASVTVTDDASDVAVGGE